MKHARAPGDYMRFNCVCVLLTGLTLSGIMSSALPGGEHTQKDAVECRIRKGLPNFFAKLEAGKPVRIAYLGGSITAANGWRGKTLAWFRKQYPKAKVDEIHAAIGGTGSGLGVYRLDHDVLRHNPDLVFVEFAVNDGGTPPESIHRSMEGIVRQIWRKNPATGICYVYTLASNMVKDLQNGKFPRSASAMEDIADHYGIPSIHMGMEVVERITAGKLIFTSKTAKSGKQTAFARDSCHPHDAGHKIYAEVVARSMLKIKREGTPGAHSIPPPFAANNWEAAKTVPLDKAMLKGKWKELDPKKHPIAKRFSARMPALWNADTPESSLRFKFKGTAVGFYDLLGPDCGQLIITIDGKPASTRARIDHYCTYHRISQLMVARDLKNDIHEVHIKVHPDQPDKVKIMRNHPDMKKNPRKYDGRNWYVGGIFLIGDLVK